MQCNPVNFILWLLVLIVFAWPISFLASFFYIIVMPFGVCCAGCADVSKFLGQGVELPKTVAQKMMS